MFRLLNPLVVLTFLTILPVGCNELARERESPLLHKPGNWEVMHKYYEPMVRNGSAYNLVIADGYFFPHTNRLNSLGAKQLNRICTSLDRFGGTVRYETRSTDEEMIEARIEAVRQYIIDTGADMTHIRIAAALPGGRGMWARDALRAVAQAEKAAEESGSAEGVEQPASTSR